MKKNKLKIPEGWRVEKLGNISDITNGKTNTQDAIEDGIYPLFDRSVDIKRSNKFLFDKTAIILPGEGAEFIPRYYSGKFDLHQRAYAIIPSDLTDSIFLYYSIYNNRDIFVKKSVGSTVKSLRLPIIQSFPIVLPPKPEQKKIAEILGVVDEDIEKTDEIIKQTEKLKKGLMKELLTKGIGHTKFKKTKLGEIPEEWGVKEMGKVCDIESGSTPRTNVPKYWDGNIVWITPFDLARLESKYFDTSARKITQNGLGNSSAVKIPANSLIMSSRAPIGYLAINKTESATNQGCKAFIPKDDNNVEYLYYYLDFNMDRIKKLGAGSTFAEVSRKHLETFLISIPNPEEQEKISDILSSIDENISVNKGLKNSLLKLKKGLMSDLLSGRVRVNK